MGLVFGILFYLSYLIPNRFQILQPRLLPMSALDEAIPLVPWTIFIYISEYLLFIIAYLIYSNTVSKNRFVWTFIGLSLSSSLVFFLFPTTYPRDLFPIPADTHWFVAAAFEGIRKLDNPNNCLPSMHIGACYATTLTYFSNEESRKKFWIFFIWAGIIAISTLTTKQHYFVDIIAGWIFAYAMYWIFCKKTEYYKTTSHIPG